MFGLVIAGVLLVALSRGSSEAAADGPERDPCAWCGLSLARGNGGVFTKDGRRYHDVNETGLHCFIAFAGSQLGGASGEASNAAAAFAAELAARGA